jgi:hypothetical protein
MGGEVKRRGPAVGRAFFSDLSILSIPDWAKLLSHESAGGFLIVLCGLWSFEQGWGLTVFLRSTWASRSQPTDSGADCRRGDTLASKPDEIFNRSERIFSYPIRVTKGDCLCFSFPRSIQ